MEAYPPKACDLAVLPISGQLWPKLSLSALLGDAGRMHRMPGRTGRLH